MSLRTSPQTDVAVPIFEGDPHASLRAGAEWHREYKKYKGEKYQ